jgi:hypothetical protein
MNCRELAELLLEFLSGELEAEYCEEIRQHLVKCPPCEAYFETYRITVTLSHNLPVRQMSVHFAEKLRSMLFDDEKREE